MTTTDFTTTMLVDQSPSEVFNAINNVRGWWSEEVEGDTDRLNSVFDYHYQDVHCSKMKIVELIPDTRVVWQVLDNYFSFTKDKEEWKDNEIIFEISRNGDQTELRFTQVGLVPEYECYDICENAWNTYIQKSLHSLITTGKGQPNGKDKPQTKDEKELASSDFTTTIFVSQTPSEVFKAVKNVAAWWDGEVKGSSENIGDEFTYRMKEFHFSVQKVVEMVPDKKIVWLVTDSRLNFLKDKSEWTGTKIEFDITWINNKTQLRFTHRGLSSGIECYEACSKGWTGLIQNSLVSLITKGKGEKVF
jgi:hypothetical protein